MEAATVVANTSTEESSLVIDVIGRFTLELHKEFRAAFENQDQRYDNYTVNMAKCTGIDSAGLGMLLILRDYTSLNREGLHLSNCPADVLQVLNYANFEQLFRIS